MYNKKASKKYRESKKGKAAEKRFRESNVGKIIYAKVAAKRKRELGYIILNNKFKGSEGHHINDTFVIFINRKIHKSIYHNHNKIESMDKINKIAFECLYNGDINYNNLNKLLNGIK